MIFWTIGNIIKWYFFKLKIAIFTDFLTDKCNEYLFFHSGSKIDGPTDWWTNKTFIRVACPQLKTDYVSLLLHSHWQKLLVRDKKQTDSHFFVVTLSHWRWLSLSIFQKRRKDLRDWRRGIALTNCPYKQNKSAEMSLELSIFALAKDQLLNRVQFRQSHPRIAHGQRYPMPCLEWLAKEVEWEQGSGPKGPMSCSTQRWISLHPEKAYFRPMGHFSMIFNGN